ncbi:MAG: TrkH family potassium uptake protein [Methylohalobius sp.]|nr:TrkH family potassium uptake protein [Methylohalobius sp.]
MVLHIVGAFFMFFSLSFLPPLGVSWYFDDGQDKIFGLAFVLVFLLGWAVWMPFREVRQELKVRDGFLVVSCCWLAVSLAGAVPLVLAKQPVMSFTDAVFECVSGLTTTGATVLVGLDRLPPSILYYRQQLQWLGGMGIVVLAVAVLPLLRIGGMQLYRAELPGPMKDVKLTPRIAQTARALWIVYLGITAACAASFWAAGMSWFDAIGHAFATVSTGGFSTHDASFSYFNSPLIEWLAVGFMAISGVNFAVHFEALRRHRVSLYWQDLEVRTYAGLLVAIALVVGTALWWNGLSLAKSMREGLFQAVSFMTSTGFTTADYSRWPAFLPVLLIFSVFIGGCAGSTAGGLKVIRILLLYKQGVREILRLIHPQAEIPVKLGNTPVSTRVVEAVWGFFSLYVAVFALIMILMMASGLDQVTAFSAVATCINNLGPGLGEVTANFASVPASAKWLASLAMLLGRLEIFTLLVLLSPAYWRS